VTVIGAALSWPGVALAGGLPGVELIAFKSSYKQIYPSALARLGLRSFAFPRRAVGEISWYSGVARGGCQCSRHRGASVQYQQVPEGSGNFVMTDDSRERRSARVDWWLVRFRRTLPLPRAWHVRRDIRHINKIYVRFIANATGQEREQLTAEWAFERTLVDERHRGLETERLQKKADRFYVPLPLLASDHWQKGPTGVWYLTPDGAEKVRRAIYEERKQRQQIWMPWIAAAVGVIGTLTGLILALKNG